MLYAAGSVRDIPVDGERLCGLTFADELLWYSDVALEQIVAVDIKSRRAVRRLSCADIRSGLTSRGRHLIQVVTAGNLRELNRYSGAASGVLVNPRPGRELHGLEAGEAGIWFGYVGPSLLDLRRPDDLRLIDTIPVDHDVAGVTVVGRLVVFASPAAAMIHLVDPQSKQIAASVGVPGMPTGLAFDGRRIWYCDASTQQLRAIEVPGLSMSDYPDRRAINVTVQPYRRH